MDSIEGKILGNKIGYEVGLFVEEVGNEEKLGSCLKIILGKIEGVSVSKLGKNELGFSLSLWESLWLE